MKTKNLEIGCWGEIIGKKYLQKKGYKIVEQNYKTKYVEIDLIVRDRRVLVFVEVRAKTGERFGTPEESINRKKINKLIKGAAAYTAEKGYTRGYRIDAVCIVLEGNKKIKRISHYQNITCGIY